jgi:hypothetical protein
MAAKPRPTATAATEGLHSGNATSTDINRHIGSELNSLRQLVYVVEWIDTTDGNTHHREEFIDHADAYAFVRDKLLSPKGA